MISKAIVIFSGYNDRAVLAFCRYAKGRNIPFYIVARDNEDYILLSEYKENVKAVRTNSTLSIDIIMDYCDRIKAENKLAQLEILPTSEFLNRILIDNKDLLFQNNIFNCLCERELYSKISDKYSFNSLCEEYGINVPQEYKAIPNHYPFVIKPKTYAKAQNVLEKPVIINSKEEYESFLKGKNIEEYYFQEFVQGDSIYLLFYFTEKGEYTVFSQENHLQQHNGASIILAKSTTHFKNPIFVTDFVKMFKSVHYKGFVMVEVRYFNDKIYIIEANPRLWGPSQLILDSNMDIFDYFAYDRNFIDSIPTCNYQENVWYYWAGGMTENQNKEKEVKLFNFTHTDLFENHSDLLKNEIYFREDSINIYYLENSIKNYKKCNLQN